MRALARFSYGRRRFVVIGWVLLLVGLFALSSAFAGKYRTEFKFPGSESKRAFDLLKEKGVTQRTGFQGQVVFQADGGVNTPAVRSGVEDFFAKIHSSVADLEIVSPYDPAHSYQISKDGKIGYAELNFSERPQEQYLKDAKAVKDLHKQIDVPGARVELGGELFAERPQFSSTLIGLLAAVVILLLVFGSVLAMGLPIITALFGIACGFALIGLLTRVLAVPEFTSEIAAMIGIGVGIDYALLIVTRYRQSLKEGLDPEASIVRSLDTSGRAVIFAGLTVVISLLGMFMMNLQFMRAVSVSAVLAVLMTMLAAVTLLPAVLGFVGRNIDKFGLPHRAEEQEISASFWYRWSRVIQAHPWPALILSAVVLVILAIPVFSLRLGFSDAGGRKTTDTTRRAYDLLSQGFGPGFNAPFLLVSEASSSDLPALQKLATGLRGTAGVASVAEPQILPNGLALMTVFPSTAPQDKETSNLVHVIRDEVVPSAIPDHKPAVLVAGAAPGAVDFSNFIADHLPLFFGAVLTLSFLLLLMVFHSVVVPLKAVLMNLLSIGASFGATVAIFQWGWFHSLIGLGKEGPIEAWAPMMLFAIVFGLSMDYEVFLLTRVREEYDRNGQDNGRAVADGLAATGRVISAAAAIMVCVFGSFILGDERSIKLLGFGLAFSVLIDATLVRLVLVPSAMELMGKANWWAPSWLVRYLPTIRVDAEASQPEPAGGSG